MREEKVGKRLKSNKGFTLVELVIVVAIMAILVGILAPQYIKYVERARKAADVQNLEHLVNSLKDFVIDNPKGDSGYELIHTNRSYAFTISDSDEVNFMRGPVDTKLSNYTWGGSGWSTMPKSEGSKEEQIMNMIFGNKWREIRLKSKSIVEKKNSKRFIWAIGYVTKDSSLEITYCPAVEKYLADNQ